MAVNEQRAHLNSAAVVALADSDSAEVSIAAVAAAVAAAAVAAIPAKSAEGGWMHQSTSPPSGNSAMPALLRSFVAATGIMAATRPVLMLCPVSSLLCFGPSSRPHSNMCLVES